MKFWWESDVSLWRYSNVKIWRVCTKSCSNWTKISPHWATSCYTVMMGNACTSHNEFLANCGITGYVVFCTESCIKMVHSFAMLWNHWPLNFLGKTGHHIWNYFAIPKEVRPKLHSTLWDALYTKMGLTSFGIAKCSSTDWPVFSQNSRGQCVKPFFRFKLLPYVPYLLLRISLNPL